MSEIQKERSALMDDKVRIVDWWCFRRACYTLDGFWWSEKYFIPRGMWNSQNITRSKKCPCRGNTTSKSPEFWVWKWIQCRQWGRNFVFHCWISSTSRSKESEMWVMCISLLQVKRHTWNWIGQWFWWQQGKVLGTNQPTWFIHSIRFALILCITCTPVAQRNPW